MGLPMAKNLIKSGFEVTAWNRTISKAQPLEALGAKLAQNPIEAVSDADFVITMLSDGYAVEELLFKNGIADAMKKDAVLLDMGSIKPKQSREFAEKLNKIGIHYIDAPVSGGTKGAQDATLAIMAGGTQDLFGRAKPVLEAMGRPTLVGPTGAGQLAKLANQSIVAITIGAVAEAILFAEQGGADPDAIRQALKGGFADSVILQQHGARMINDDFVPGGLSKFQLKDINNVLEEAKACNLSLPLTEQMQERFNHFVNELDGAEKDHSGIYIELKNRNKLS